MIFSWFYGFPQFPDQSSFKILHNSASFKNTSNTELETASAFLSVANDIIITEIFADPTPQVDLPLVEYIELFNTGSETIFLKNWTYSDASTIYMFTGDSIKSGEYLILCPRADMSSFINHGRVLGLSPWPSLNNAGDVPTLKNESGVIINQVKYADSWYKDASKKSGGYSLELIDLQTRCSGIQNWTASIDPTGGTPGRQNSVYKPSVIEYFKLLNATLSDSSSILLTFNHSLDSLSAVDSSNYFFNNGIGNPASATPLAPDFKQVNLQFPRVISRGNTYRATVGPLTDCAGSVLSANFNTVEFFLPKRILKNDILINEILFNPRKDGFDFVEIYNNSGTVLDLRELFLANSAKDTLAKKTISPSQLLIKPAEYVVLTLDPENVKKEYLTENPGAFLKMKAMPGLNDDEGTVILLSNKQVIDHLNYSDKMHFPLIKDTEGVSLERSAFNRPGNDSGNFRSAAAIVGFATPGYKNSQAVDELNLKEEFSLSSKTFSPDNDGFEDELQINFHFNQSDLVANIKIYTDKGILVKKLTNNLTLSSEGIINWNGFDEFSQLSQVGIYLVYAEFFDLDGKIKKYRRTCVLAQKLN